MQKQMSLTCLFNNIPDLTEYFDLIQRLDNEDINDKFNDQIFSLFQINLEKYFETEFYLCHKGGLSIQEIDNMEYYRFQYYLMNYKKFIDEENKRREQEENGGKKNMFADVNNLIKNPNKMLGNSFKTPNLGSIPKLK